MLVLSAVLIVSEILVNAVITYESYNDYNVTFYSCGQGRGHSLLFARAFSSIQPCAEQKFVRRAFAREAFVASRTQTIRSFESKRRTYQQKCHDLKYQIRTIGEQRIIETDVINEIESAVSFYDSAVKTGNDALDIIIREKVCSAAPMP